MTVRETVMLDILKYGLRKTAEIHEVEPDDILFYLGLRASSFKPHRARTVDLMTLKDAVARMIAGERQSSVAESDMVRYATVDGWREKYVGNLPSPFCGNREVVINLYNFGMTASEIADKTKTRRRIVERWIAKHERLEPNLGV